MHASLGIRTCGDNETPTSPLFKLFPLDFTHGHLELSSLIYCITKLWFKNQTSEYYFTLLYMSKVDLSIYVDP